MKCVFLIIFLVQNLINSADPIFMWLRWIWNSTFWLAVKNFKKYREYDKIQNVCTRCMYQIQELVKCKLFLFLLASYEHIHLGSNQLLLHPLRSKPIIKTPFLFKFQMWRTNQGLSLKQKRSHQLLGKYYCILGRIWLKQGIRE